VGLRRLTGDAWVFDPGGAVVRVPAVALVVAAGLVAGHPVPGAIAATAAFLVGMGAQLELRGSHVLLLSVATLLVGASATLGSVAAAHGVVAIVVVGALGALCGLAASRDAATAWVGLQCALAGIIATSYPASLTSGAERALFVVLGGLTQTIFLTVGRAALRRTSPPSPVGGAAPRYAVHLAVGLAASLAAGQLLAIGHGYWVPMTTLLVLRPTTRSTVSRALARTVGTVAGVALATALLVATHPPVAVEIAFVAVAACGAYTFQRATYGLFSGFVSMYVIFILSLAGSPAGEVARTRIYATLLGATIGIAVQVADEVIEWARLRHGRR
jgi:hypothetical protein